MKNQSEKQSRQSITNHTKQFLKTYHTSIRNALKREIMHIYKIKSKIT